MTTDCHWLSLEIELRGRHVSAASAYRKDSIMRGRRPSGLEFVDKLDGSAKAKERLRAIVETMTGARRVLEACDRFGHQGSALRSDPHRGLARRLAGAGGPARRPSSRAATPADEENRQLRERIARLEGELQAALIRAEIAVTLPEAGAAAEKKTTSKPRGRGRSSPTKRSS